MKGRESEYYSSRYVAWYCCTTIFPSALVSLPFSNAMGSAQCVPSLTWPFRFISHWPRKGSWPRSRIREPSNQCAAASSSGSALSGGTRRWKQFFEISPRSRWDCLPGIALYNLNTASSTFFEYFRYSHSNLHEEIVLQYVVVYYKTNYIIFFIFVLLIGREILRNDFFLRTRTILETNAFVSLTD